MRVEVASRMKESSATGPVLKAGPKAAFTVKAVNARTEMGKRRHRGVKCRDAFRFTVGFSSFGFCRE